VDVVAVSVELAELVFEVGAHVAHDRLEPLEVAPGEDRVPVFRAEHQASLRHENTVENTVPASADVAVFSHEPSYNQGVQLRYSYRLYPSPGQQRALARAFGCARVVFNDALRARQAAYEAGEPYISDAELSRRLTQSKADPARAWLGEVSAVVLQQALADLNARTGTSSPRSPGNANGPGPGRPGSGPGRIAGRLSGSPRTPGSGCWRTRSCGCPGSVTCRCGGPGRFRLRRLR
jgi:hypothetical protein